MQAVRTQKYSISKPALKKTGKRNMETAPKPKQIICKRLTLHVSMCSRMHARFVYHDL